MMGKRKDKGEVERSRGDGRDGTWAHSAGLGTGCGGQPSHGAYGSVSKGSLHEVWEAQRGEE